jgi:uncharacterized membrane protein YoaK (UPF0700 family)
MRKRLRRHPAGLQLGLMLALTFSTGVIDAVGYLGLDRVFTGNMTGNVVILGMALVGADDLPILGPVVALVLFMAGAMVSGTALRRLAAGWSTRTTALLAIVAALLGAAGAAVFLMPADRPEAATLAVTGALGLAMGMQAGAARHVAVKDVTTVVVTSTLVGLAFDSRLTRGSGDLWKRRAGAVALIGAGAAVGAALLTVHIGLGMVAAALVTILAATIGHFGRPHPVEDSLD